MADATQLSCIPRAFAALAALTDDELASELGIDVATVRTYRSAPHETTIEHRQRLVVVLRGHGIPKIATELELETDAAAWFYQRMRKAIDEGLSREAAEKRVWRELAEQAGDTKAVTAQLTHAGLAPGRQS